MHHAYSKWEWRVLRFGFFSIMGLSLPSVVVGVTGMVLGDRTFMLPAAAGLAAAAVIGGVTVVILQITGRQRRKSREES